jgi:arylesterase/paraoxonase
MLRVWKCYRELRAKRVGEGTLNDLTDLIVGLYINIMKIRKGTGLLSAFILIVLVYGIHVCTSTGYFREINNTFNGTLLRQINIPGVEDIEINHTDSFLIFTSDDRSARRDGRPRQGGLYKIDLIRSDLTPIELTKRIDWPFHPHGLSLFRIDDERTRLFVVNHVKEEHSVEVFDLEGGELTHVARLKSEEMVSPNDIVAVNSKQFYFTNDHGYTRGIGRVCEEYLGLAFGNVVYFDGQTYTEVASRIAYANGINMDTSRQLIYVASVRDFQIGVYQRRNDGNLIFVENIECGSGVDNIDLDRNGDLWAGCHPSLLTYKSYSTGKRQYAPSEIISINYRSKGEYTLTQEYMNDGTEMSASTVACKFGSLIFAGNVMDDHFIVLKMAE